VLISNVRPPPGELPTILHERLFQGRVQARGGFVEEQQQRLGQQLYGDADPLTLPPRKAIGTHLSALLQL